MIKKIKPEDILKKTPQQLVAEAAGVSVPEVSNVWAGRRNNKKVIKATEYYREGLTELRENAKTSI